MPDHKPDDAPTTRPQHVLAQFEIGNPRAIEPLGNGLINDSWRVSLAADERQLVLQRINGTVFPEPVRVMENITRVGQHLARKYGDGRFPDPQRRCLMPHHAATGRPWWRDPQGHYWRLFDFISASSSIDRISSDAVAYQAGLGFGGFVADLDDLPEPSLHQTIAGFHDTAARLQALEAARLEHPERAAGVVDELQRIRALTWLVQRLDEVNAAAPMPQRVVHNDTKVDNLLFDQRSGEALCVIDLDTVMPGLVIHDFGDMVRNGAAAISDTGVASFSLERFEALTRGYLAGCGHLLTASETTWFPLAGPLLAFELAARFLTDYLHGNVYFKVDFDQQNLHRCRQQLGLAELMLAQTGAMEAVVTGALVDLGG